jgi:hypothetical protein
MIHAPTESIEFATAMSTDFNLLGSTLQNLVD